jgi:hypothetical protein
VELQRLRDRDPRRSQSFEEWLIRVAKLRANKHTGKPSVDLPNEGLIVALLLLENKDLPGLLESAALMLSRLCVDQKELARLTKRERVDFLLRQLAG